MAFFFFHNLVDGYVTQSGLLSQDLAVACFAHTGCASDDDIRKFSHLHGRCYLGLVSDDSGPG